MSFSNPQSSTYCHIDTVYSHLDRIGQTEWDLIETLYQSNVITESNHDKFLQQILNNYGLALLSTNQTAESMLKTENIASLQDCRKRILELERENLELRQQMQN